MTEKGLTKLDSDKVPYLRKNDKLILCLEEVLGLKKGFHEMYLQIFEEQGLNDGAVCTCTRRVKPEYYKEYLLSYLIEIKEIADKFVPCEYFRIDADLNIKLKKRKPLR